MKRKNQKNQLLGLIGAGISRSAFLAPMTVLALSACTGQLPNSFRLQQQDEAFNANIEINTKIDLLWVVDNSSSMEAQQEKLRQGFTGFANKYLQPTWDIQVAVITSDTYLANPAFQNYLNSTIAGTTGWQSPYVFSRRATWTPPASNPTLVNTTNWTFGSGIRIKDMVPAWGASYSRLLPGLHDGPIAGFCFEGMPYSMISSANCQLRDKQNIYNGTSHCLNPDATAGETEQNMCQNTIENDTVHSGKAIIRTMPTTALTGAALTAWTDQLVADFKVNASVGITGMGSERGLSSLIQVIQDNEVVGSPTQFFRAGALRGIIFVTDEEDQSMTIPSDGTQIVPFQNYQCDQTSLVSLNGAAPITGAFGYCCTNPANHCTYGTNGTSCPTKVIDGTNFTVSLCADPTKLIAVSDVKNQLDGFFSTLDGTTGNPNYFIATITPLTMASITALQNLHDADDQASAAINGATYVMNKTVNRGDRYLALGDLVGNGSLSLDINTNDYAPLLDQIGQAILLKKSTFPLSRTPTGEEDMIITLVHANGFTVVIQPTQYSVSGNNVIITDQNLVLSFAASDKLLVTYQPKSLTH